MRHRSNISSKGAVSSGRNDAEMGPANLLHASSSIASTIKDSIWLFEHSKKEKLITPKISI